MTFLFTDIEGSTGRWQDDPELMRARLAAHDEAMRQVMDEHRGYMFKHTGDGVAVVFASASDAAEAAVAAQRCLGEILPVRMGLHTGEAELRDGDYYGEVVNRCARVMGVAHAGQVLVSNATAALLGGQPFDGIEIVQLGTVRLRGLHEPEVVHQITVEDLPSAFPALDGQALDNLPRPRTSFVGRADAVDAVTKLLGTHEAVTLVGVGGTGKTRLSIEVARHCLGSFPDGVIFVALADVDDAGGVARAIADAAELRGGGVPDSGAASEHRELVLRAFAQREALLVVDNCEHLLDSVAGLLDEILQRSPGVRVLATSREPLGVDGERVWRVPALDDGAAVELFVERARATRADLALSAADEAVATDLCRRLDGLPLAIELAAARLRVMSVEDVARRLDDRFRLLAGRGRTHDRHATLRATLDWSFELLDPDEQLLLARLSVFAGGFDLDAAERVCGTDPIGRADLLDLLAALVDKSLVVAGDRAGCSRYWLLETVRAYAADRLAGRGDTDPMTERHAAWVVRLARRYWASYGELVSMRHDDTFVREVDNARMAHAWAVENARADDARLIASVFAMTWHDRGNAAEAFDRCEAALAVRTGESSPFVECLCVMGAVLSLHWRMMPSWPYCLRGVELSDGIEEIVGLFVWTTLVTVAASFDPPEGLTFDECLARARAADPDDQRHGYHLMIEGQHRLRTNRAAEAQSLLETALDTLTTVDLKGWDRLMLAVSQYVLSGSVALTERDVDQICVGDSNKRPIVLELQAIQAAVNGAPANAIIAEALDLTRRFGMAERTLFTAAAAAAFEGGDPETATRLLGAALNAPDWVSTSLSQRTKPLLREALGTEEFDRLVIEGQQLDERAAVTLMLTIP